MTPEEIVTVVDRTVYVYGEAMCTWLARAEAQDYARDLRRHIARAMTEAGGTAPPPPPASRETIVRGDGTDPC